MPKGKHCLNWHTYSNCHRNIKVYDHSPKTTTKTIQVHSRNKWTYFSEEPIDWNMQKPWIATTNAITVEYQIEQTRHFPNHPYSQPNSKSKLFDSKFPSCHRYAIYEKNILAALELNCIQNNGFVKTYLDFSMSQWMLQHPRCYAKSKQLIQVNIVSMF